MSTTIRDVSKASNVSISTISKYLNGGEVRNSTKKKIDAAIAGLNYIPNAAAKSLITRKSHTVGVMLPFISNSFCADIVQYFNREISKYGYGILLCDCDWKGENQLPKAKFLIEKMVDGILSMPLNEYSEFIEYSRNRKIPVVVVDHKAENLTDSVLSDNIGASYEATMRLLDMGHTEIAIFYGTQKATALERLYGYQKAFYDKGIPFNPELVIDTEYSYENAYGMMKKIWNSYHPTAVYTTNYDITLGAIRAISEMELKIGRDISFIGFDNMELIRLIFPKISIVKQSVEEIGITAARILVKRMNGDNENFPIERRIKTTLNVTESVVDLRTKKLGV